MIKAPDPPFVDFFRNLPMSRDGKKWAVSGVFLDKDGCQLSVYISMGTDTARGAARRMIDYDNRSNGSAADGISQEVEKTRFLH